MIALPKCFLGRAAPIAVALVLAACRGSVTEAGANGSGNQAASAEACAAGSEFVATSDLGKIGIYRDGGGWRFVSGLPTNGGLNFYALARGGGRFLALTADGRVAASSDGESWQLGEATTGIDAFDMVYDDGAFWACGKILGDGPLSARVVRSLDGATWEPVGPPLDGALLVALARAGDNLVAVAQGPEAKGKRPTALFHLSAGAWVRTTPWVDGSTSSYINGMAYADVAFAGGTFIAVGARGVARSSDGAHWSETPEAQLTAVAPALGGFVAAGPGRGGLSAAASWQLTSFEVPHASPEITMAMYDVAYNGCSFLAVGGDMGWYGSSPDGLAWTTKLGPIHWDWTRVVPRLP